MEDLDVYHNGEKVLKLNNYLLDSQKAWDNIEQIKLLHIMRLDLESLMYDFLDDPEILQRCDKIYTKLEFLLQDFWNFPRDYKHHCFWDRPGCTCPKMDNADRHPTGVYIKRQDCPLHGWEVGE